MTLTTAKRKMSYLKSDRYNPWQAPCAVGQLLLQPERSCPVPGNPSLLGSALDLPSTSRQAKHHIAKGLVRLTATRVMLEANISWFTRRGDKHDRRVTRNDVAEHSRQRMDIKPPRFAFTTPLRPQPPFHLLHRTTTALTFGATQSPIPQQHINHALPHQPRPRHHRSRLPHHHHLRHLPPRQPRYLRARA